MTSKVQFYSAMASYTATHLTDSWQRWTAFLTTASRLYKYPFHEQLMIFAQRPDATACAEYDLWNDTMRRYVRRGSKGIALVDNSREKPRLRYVFDISDTGLRKNSRHPFLWELRPEHEAAVAQALTERFGAPLENNLAEQLEREGIPHFSLRPCKESILDDFHALIGDIRESMLQNSLVACCIIEIPEASRTLENEELLESALDVFGRSQNCNILARKNREHFEVITSNMEARKITDEYKTCMLSSELNQKLPFPIRIGWGISFDVIDAYKNAKKAVLACQKNRNHYTYLVTESQEMVGPLNSNRSISYGLQPDAQVSFLAKSLGISPVNLEKLVSLQKTRYMYEFTSSDLVYFLEITPRSAARILSKLEKGGLARPIRSVNLSGTGRPTIVYEVDFHTLSD